MPCNSTNIEYRRCLVDLPASLRIHRLLYIAVHEYMLDSTLMGTFKKYFKIYYVRTCNFTRKLLFITYYCRRLGEFLHVNHD